MGSERMERERELRVTNRGRWWVVEAWGRTTTGRQGEISWTRKFTQQRITCWEVWEFVYTMRGKADQTNSQRLLITKSQYSSLGDRPSIACESVYKFLCSTLPNMGRIGCVDNTAQTTVLKLLDETSSAKDWWVGIC